jgi:ClpP class serine protease
MPRPRHPRALRARTLADARAQGLDPLVMFRAAPALAIDEDWLARVTTTDAPLGFWSSADDGDDPDDEDEDLPYARVQGVAVYTIEGPLTQRAWFSFPGYDSIRADVERALADPAVRGLLLRIDSPGGVVAGLFDTAAALRAAVVASGKPCVAVADELCCSAAYGLACVADTIVTPATGLVGSVGVIASLASFAARLAAKGIDARVFASGAEKADGHPALPISDETAARVQARVDDLAAIFTGWVADRRGMTPAAVQALEAGVRTGAGAVAAGLADRVASFDATLAALVAEVAPAAPPVAATPAPLPSPPPAPGSARTHTRTAHMDARVEAEVVAATGATEPEEQLGKLRALGATAARVPALEAEATRLRADLAAAARAGEDRDRAAFVAELEAAGKLTPAQRKGFEAAMAPGADRAADWLAGSPMAALRSFGASAPVVAPKGLDRAALPQPELPAPATPGAYAPQAALTAEQAAYCRAKGFDAAKYLKSINDRAEGMADR